VASGFSTATRNTVLDTLFYTPTIYGALCLGDPGNAGDLAGHEVAALYGYARTAIQMNTHASVTPGTISNDAECAFSVANGGAWGDVTYLAIVTAAVEGVNDSIASGALTIHKQIDDTDQLKFAIGAISVSIAAQA